MSDTRIEVPPLKRCRRCGTLITTHCKYHPLSMPVVVSRLELQEKDEDFVAKMKQWEIATND